MKIYLINPQSLTTSDTGLQDIFNNMSNVSGYIESLQNGISTGLLTIAAVTPEGNELEFVDENHDPINFSPEYDIVAISAATQQASRAYEIAAKFKALGVKTAIGGIHATVMPEEAGDHFDHVFVGEGEETWPKFIQDVKNKCAKKTYKNETPLDLTKYPMPRYDLLKKDNYSVMWIQSSRGCPHDCEFCAATKVFGMRLRYKSVKQVVNEIMYIKKVWGDIKIDFADDNLFSNKKFARALISELKVLNIKWYAQTDISIANDDKFLGEIKEAGCLTFLIGFESVSPTTLGNINKNSWKLKQLPKYKKGIEIIQSKGIGVVGAFIVGFDEDDMNTLKETADFITGNKLFASQVAILTPFPGTSLYKKLKEENRLYNVPWKNYTVFQATFKPKQMTGKELVQGLSEIYEKIYSPQNRLKVMEYFKNIYKANKTNKLEVN